MKIFDLLSYTELKELSQHGRFIFSDIQREVSDIAFRDLYDLVRITENKKLKEYLDNMLELMPTYIDLKIEYNYLMYELRRRELAELRKLDFTKNIPIAIETNVDLCNFNMMNILQKTVVKLKESLKL